MGRYRKPDPELLTKTNYITRDGYDKLEKELTYLWKDERPRITKSVSEAAAQGDRSENAEYIYGKKRLREIDWRVRFLTKRLEILKVIYPSSEQEGKVFFGAWVEVENDEGELTKIRIVGPDEIDVFKKWISIDAPMARALIGKQVDEEALVQTPTGKVCYIVNSISYHPPEVVAEKEPEDSAK
ncbi:transcription elongation factor GreB [uncultured Psychrosphaera sp.]|uniref:transcription elongation factor GreB n=1 Tax=uncultured Psychrosphaera sp. TaxID=1403522 RepID=UPI00260CE3E2|nr:transcription elongation factor GreB [uncultured Psychrosphaera sp.]